MKTSKRFLVAAMLIATSFTFIGCSGDDGSDGKDGNHVASRTSVMRSNTPPIAKLGAAMSNI
jgi:hypothetical protein